MRGESSNIPAPGGRKRGRSKFPAKSQAGEGKWRKKCHESGRIQGGRSFFASTGGGDNQGRKDQKRKLQFFEGGEHPQEKGNILLKTTSGERRGEN